MAALAPELTRALNEALRRPDLYDPAAFAAPAHSTTASTDASGVLTLDLDADTALSIGQSGFLLLYKAGAAATDDLIFSGRLTVQDIS